jgi:hypothetical protein
LKFLKVHLKTFPKSWHGQIFFKPVDQIGNVDRLSQNWMSLNAETRSSVAQRGEKDDGRSLQLRISIDFACSFDSVYLWHHYTVQQDQVRPEIVGTLMSFGSVVLFEYDVAASFFEKDFERVCTVLVVINNQDASLFHRRPPIECFVHRSPCGGSRRQITLEKMVPIRE